MSLLSSASASVSTDWHWHTIGVLKSAVQKAKLGREEELQALKRLDEQARRLECVAIGSSLETLMIEEHSNSSSYDGRTVFGKAQAAAITAPPSRQALRRRRRSSAIG
ncbi:MAG TPA: hypothetical protein VET25_11070 [Aestuariivirgaceae bacterium]|nr:hypothetical protein [Aestuariivirgaceae bacterium]